MTAHKYAAIVKAKADNMDLVLFSMSTGSDYGKWSECNRNTMPKDNENIKYFLCLPKHKEAVLNTLNGGESQVNYGEYWSEANCGSPVRWGKSWWYMSDGCESRIKPRKEMRWIAVKGDITSNLYETKRELELMYATTRDVRFIEIEI